MKSGLDWFRVDVDFDDKFELVCAEFGSSGFEVIVRLWQKIYKEAGYYLEWNTEVALLFAKKHSLSGSAVSEIVKCCIRRGLFDQGMFEKYGILTSHGVQKWYFESTKRRENVKVVNEYLLIPVPKNMGNVNRNAENVCRNAENVCRNKHSTVQYSIHKKESIKEKSDPVEPKTDKPSSRQMQKFKKPTVEEIEEYCKGRGNHIDAQRFFDFYESKGWLVGRTPMRDWKASVRTWEKREMEYTATGNAKEARSGSCYTKEQLDSLFDDLNNI